MAANEPARRMVVGITGALGTVHDIRVFEASRALADHVHVPGDIRFRSRAARALDPFGLDTKTCPRWTGPCGVEKPSLAKRRSGE